MWGQAAAAVPQQRNVWGHDFASSGGSNDVFAAFGTSVPCAPPMTTMPGVPLGAGAASLIDAGQATKTPDSWLSQFDPLA